MDKNFRKNLERYFSSIDNIDNQLKEKFIRDISNLIENNKVQTDENKVAIDGIVLDRLSYTLFIDNKEVKRTAKKGKKNEGITKKEFELLDLLMRNPGIMYTRKMILDRVWGDNVVVNDRTVDVHICKIKELLGKKYEEKIISRKGVGYKFQQ